MRNAVNLQRCAARQAVERPPHRGEVAVEVERALLDHVQRAVGFHLRLDIDFRHGVGLRIGPHRSKRHENAWRTRPAPPTASSAARAFPTAAAAAAADAGVRTACGGSGACGGRQCASSCEDANHSCFARSCSLQLGDGHAIIANRTLLYCGELTERRRCSPAKRVYATSVSGVDSLESLGTDVLFRRGGSDGHAHIPSSFFARTLPRIDARHFVQPCARTATAAPMRNLRKRPPYLHATLSRSVRQSVNVAVSDIARFRKLRSDTETPQVNELLPVHVRGHVVLSHLPSPICPDLPRRSTCRQCSATHLRPGHGQVQRSSLFKVRRDRPTALLSEPDAFRI